jgi:hypothetical protein
MSLGLVSTSAPVAGQSQQVVKRLEFKFNPDGSISMDGTVCDRVDLGGDSPVDINLRTVSATYPSEEVLISLTVATWAPSTEMLAAMAGTLNTAEGAVSTILAGFIGISKAGINVLIAAEDAPPSPPEEP